MTPASSRCRLQRETAKVSSRVGNFLSCDSRVKADKDCSSACVNQLFPVDGVAKMFLECLTP